MSDEEEIDLPTVDFSSAQQINDVERANLSLKLLPNGKIDIDWTGFPRHPSCHQFIVHYRSLNDNHSKAIAVGHKKRRFILQRFPVGHLYEIHVYAVDRSKKILDFTEARRIQSSPIDDSPILFISESTPDSIRLKWNKSNSVRSSQIQSYKLMINGETKGIFPANKTEFLFNHGRLGKRYVFQIEMIDKKGRMNASLPILMKWPAVTLPKRQVVVNGNTEIIITWEDSISINDGEIESYTLYLYDFHQNLLKQMGPYGSETRQVWIKDLEPNLYYYSLKIQIADSTRSLSTEPVKIQCGRQSTAPLLTYERLDSKYQDQLTDVTYQLIRYHDHLKSRHLRAKTDELLEQYLRTLGDVADAIRVKLIIESRSEENPPPNYRLLIDGRTKIASIPWFIKEFPLELRHRERPYELAVALVDETKQITSEKLLVQAYGHFSFFCAHFDQHQANYTCSYIETFLLEKQTERQINQGFLSVPQTMATVQLYNIKSNRIVRFPPVETSSRFTILLFFVKNCVPSFTHLKYFSTYATTNHQQFNYIAVNCNQKDLDEVEQIIEDYQGIECYSDFSEDDFEYETKDDETPIHRLLSIHGVPTYSVLDFYGQIVWKGRLCVRDQDEYNQAIDQISAEVNQLAAADEAFESPSASLVKEEEVKVNLDYAERLLQSIGEQRSTESIVGKQERRLNQRQQIVSMRNA